jgi:hypothetical protein
MTYVRFLISTNMKLCVLKAFYLRPTTLGSVYFYLEVALYRALNYALLLLR